MALHLKRTETSNDKHHSSFKGARISSWEPPAHNKSVLEIQHYPNPTVLQNVPDSKNTLIPPPHWHWYQQEYFNIKFGRFIFTLEGQQKVVSAKDPQPVTIPAGARHTFKVDPSCSEPCIVEISTEISPRAKESEADEVGMTERFFRNVYSYLDDCDTQEVAPSLPQLVLFLHAGEVSLAFPGPRWIANPISYVFGLVVGVGVGEYLLGYKRSYPEYYASATNKKSR